MGLSAHRGAPASSYASMTASTCAPDPLFTSNLASPGIEQPSFPSRILPSQYAAPSKRENTFVSSTSLSAQYSASPSATRWFSLRMKSGVMTFPFAHVEPYTSSKISTFFASVSVHGSFPSSLCGYQMTYVVRSSSFMVSGRASSTSGDFSQNTAGTPHLLMHLNRSAEVDVAFKGTGPTVVLVISPASMACCRRWMYSCTAVCEENELSSASATRLASAYRCTPAPSAKGTYVDPPEGPSSSVIFWSMSYRTPRHGSEEVAHAASAQGAWSARRNAAGARMRIVCR
mmetsp:Transcript_9721/g.41305  ORF Transcript_9721/g.41305 Transcript_9721/m.41305 type:complete len:287 (+) Transcript_9721:298-1158(+)